MKKILVAGATGYLGGFIVKQLKAQNYWVRVLVRNAKQAEAFKGVVDDIFIGQITDKTDLNGVMADIDMVMSSVGITRQRDGMTYMDVDYGANLNLLELAENADVKKFLYVHVINADKLTGVKLIDAKVKFAKRLEASALESVLICPNGFFGDIIEILQMARGGKCWMIGDGSMAISPISGGDLADICVASINDTKSHYNVAGPETFTMKQLFELAFKTLNKPVKLSTIPIWVIKPLLATLKLVTSVKFHGPIDFMVSAMLIENMEQGEHYGTERVEDFFRKSL